MKTQKTEVKTFIEHWVCEECNRGTLCKDTGGKVDIRPEGIFIPHICTVCDNIQYLNNDSYPKTVYEYI